jgi:antitoxin (DNA-binding transcriptional repressor) of toxin-antitoxin stability system
VAGRRYPPLFERSGTVQASGVVSVRQLARSASGLIDRVERDGDVIALCRYDRMVAILAPLPEKIVVEFEGSGSSPRLPNEDCDVERLELPEWLENRKEAQAILLRALDAHPMPFSNEGLPSPIGDTLGAMTHLELGGFSERTLRGTFLTRLGIAAARVLRRRLDSES